MAVKAGTALRVHVVVTCSHRKSRPVPSRLRLRTVTGIRMSTRVQSWTQRLSDERVPTVRALDLYAGEHWTLVRELTGNGAPGKPQVSLWVCSAGYGLVPAGAQLRPYSATFSSGQPDTVPGGRVGLTEWWAALGEWAGPAEAPRSIAQLVATDPAARVLLVLSANYLAACRDDILDAVEAMDSVNLSIVSAGAKGPGDLVEFVLPGDARLQSALGGTRQSLNVRIARHLLDKGIVSHAEMRDLLAELLAAQPALLTYNRARMTDAELRSFIRRRLRREPDATHTTILRALRDSGRACEQGRFAALFASTKATGR